MGLACVVLIAGAIIGYKAHVARTSPAVSTMATFPRVILVADLSEANAPGDACAEIIHLVRAARDRGVAVQELDRSSKSGLLSRYHVLTVPTVLILDRNGRTISRFEGEARDTVRAVRTGLEQLH